MNRDEFAQKKEELIFIIILPILIVFSICVIISFSDEFVSNTTAMNNIIAPAAALVSVVLTYVVFVFQNEFNKKQELTQRTNSIDSYIKETVDLINDIEWNGRKGVIAIREFNIEEKYIGHKRIVHTFFDELNSVLIRFKDIRTQISTIEDESIKEIYYKRLYTLFYSKILWNLNKSYFEDGQADKIISKKMHDDSVLTIEVYIEFASSCIDYLIKAKVASDSKYKKDILDKFLNFLEKNRSAMQQSKF